MSIYKGQCLAKMVLIAVWLCMQATALHAQKDPRVTMEEEGFTVHGVPYNKLRERTRTLISGRPIRVFENGGIYQIYSVAFSPGGWSALSGGVKRYVRISRSYLRLWDVDSGKERIVFREHVAFVSSVAFSPNGMQFLSGSEDKTLRLWDVKGGAVLRVFQGHQYGVNSVVFSPDGKQVLSGSGDKTLRLWDVASGAVLHVFRGHEGSVQSVAFSPDGRQVLSGSNDTTLRLWDVDSGKERIVFRGHEAWVWSVALSPDGKQALSGSEDKTLRLWDVASGKTLRVLRGHKSGIRSVAFSQDGRVALSGGGDELQLWDPRRILPGSLDSKQMQNAVQEAVQEHFKNLVGLPDVVKKDPFESEEMYQQRAAEVAQSRNVRVESIRENIQQHRLNAYSAAVVNVQGHPLLDALEDEAGRPKYESETGQLHLSFHFLNSSEARDWVFNVPAGEPVRNLYRALKNGDVSASAEYRLQGDIATLEAVIAHHEGKTYRGSPATGDFEAPERQISVFGSSDQLKILDQRGSNSGVPLVVNTLYIDDIPGLLSEARATSVDNSKWLFVIGIGDYSDTDDINYSRRTAEAFAKVAQKTLGISEKRTVKLLDEKATSGRIDSLLSLMLGDIGEGDTIYFYYSGHGIPVPEQDGAAFILPQDVHPDIIQEKEEFQVDRIYRRLIDSKASSVIAFMDSCFTGVTDGRSVFKGDKGATRLAPRIFEPRPTGKLAVLTAGTEKQYSNGYREKGHRLFSYFVMKALLQGHQNVRSLYAQVYDEVSETTIDLGGSVRRVRQDPVLQGNPDLEI